MTERSRLVARLLTTLAIPFVSSCEIPMAIHDYELRSEWERNKDNVQHIQETDCWEYKKYGFGIANFPTKFVRTERKWDKGFGPERYWEPYIHFECEEDMNNGSYPVLQFGAERIPESLDESKICDSIVAGFSRSISHMLITGGKQRIGGRGFVVTNAVDEGSYNLPRDGKAFTLCRRELTLANGQDLDFTVCYLHRQPLVFVFYLATPEPRRDDDFQLMMAWMDSLYFLTNSSAASLQR
jgi:hypothetical protein